VGPSEWGWSAKAAPLPLEMCITFWHWPCGVVGAVPPASKRIGKSTCAIAVIPRRSPLFGLAQRAMPTPERAAGGAQFERESPLLSTTLARVPAPAHRDGRTVCYRNLYFVLTARPRRGPRGRMRQGRIDHHRAHVFEKRRAIRGSGCRRGAPERCRSSRGRPRDAARSGPTSAPRFGVRTKAESRPISACSTPRVVVAPA